MLERHALVVRDEREPQRPKPKGNPSTPLR